MRNGAQEARATPAFVGSLPHALVVDDDAHSLSALAALVEREGFSVDAASSLAEARKLAERRAPEVVLVDLQLGDGSGLEFISDLAAEGAVPEFVVVTGNGSMETAISALRKGAADYLTKPVDATRLKTVLANLVRTHAFKGQIEELRSQLRDLGRFGSMVGSAPPMQAMYDRIARVAPTDASVLISGESGTGKELVAETLHRLSRRSVRPFVALNCGAISATLIESELFGHERGSFTGADRAHRGFFERADGGTLLLDEIGEMPVELQVKLLRVLESGTLSRVGGDRAVRVDVRVLASTNRDLDEAVQAGRFRADLLYRLRVVPIAVPPLREREGDIEILAQHFLGELNAAEGTRKRFAPEAMERLRRYGWPGNVRELKNLVHSAFILAHEVIGPPDLPASLGFGVAAPAVAPPTAEGILVSPGTPLAHAERRMILSTLELFAGDKRRAAEALGISLKTLYNRLREYNAAGAIADV